MNRYNVRPGPPINGSRTARVRYAKDVVSHQEVCLKYMKHKEQFLKEINGRFGPTGKKLDSSSVVQVVGWHTPAGVRVKNAAGQRQEEESTAASDEYPWVLVMEQGERSLHEVCAKERIAGFVFLVQ